MVVVSSIQCQKQTNLKQEGHFDYFGMSSLIRSLMLTALIAVWTWPNNASSGRNTFYIKGMEGNYVTLLEHIYYAVQWEREKKG